MQQNINFLVQSVCDVPIINTSYQKLHFGSGDYPDKLFFHQAKFCLVKKELILLGEKRAYLGSPQSQNVTFGNSC